MKKAILTLAVLCGIGMIVGCNSGTANEMEFISLRGKEIKFCVGCLYCQKTGACVFKDDVPAIMESVLNADVVCWATPIYYFTLCAQIQVPIQRMYCVNKPAEVKKMALLMSSYSPNIYDGATADFRDICNYWEVEDMGSITVKIDKQKTNATRKKVVDLVAKL